MQLKTKLIAVGVPTVAAIAVGSAVAARRRRQKASRFLRDDTRDALKGLMSAQTAKVIPGELAPSFTQRKLNRMTDKRLIGAYLAVKVAETLYERGVDIRRLPQADVAHEAERLLKDEEGRKELAGRLTSFGVDVASGVLNDALAIATGAI